MLWSETPIHPILKNLLATRGIRELYPPQELAVKAGIFEGKNVVMATQTASGKTFLAEVLAIHNVINNGGKTIYLTPLKALAGEKFEDFKKYEELNIKTIMTVGNYDSSEPILERYDVIVTTYEKMDSILRHKPSWISQVSLVIIDEIHYIDDEKRGPVLESLIAKLKGYFNNPQIVALSATIGNPEELSSWLDAELVSSEWRPVPLKEGVYYRGKIVYKDGDVKKIRMHFASPILDLVNDTISEGGQALIFVNSRRRAVSLAENISKRMTFKIEGDIYGILEELRESSDVHSLNEQLSSLIKNGVSFHHAGLTVVQRKLIERAFRSGIIKVLTATPTLAAGVNLPARRVIIESSDRYVAGEGKIPIKVLEYKQFAGRAGRPGFDEFGEAILIASNNDELEDYFAYYINGKPERISSKMGEESAFRAHLLSFIASFGPLTKSKVYEFVKHTLFYKQSEGKGVAKLINETLNFLKERGFVEDLGLTMGATEYGKYVSELYIDPLSAEYAKIAFSKKRKPTEFSVLHLIAATPDMPKLQIKRRELALIDSAFTDMLPEILIGLEDRDVSYEDMLGEIKTALFLYDWINEVPDSEICEKYDLGPGDIYSYIESAAWISYSIFRLANIIPGAITYSGLLEEISVRVKYGIKKELTELVSIPGIGRVRARNLYNAGFRTIKDLRNATIKELSAVKGIGEKLSIKIREFVEKEGHASNFR